MTEDDRILCIRTLEKAGVEIRIGNLESDGGLVKLADVLVLFIQKNIPLQRECTVYLLAIQKLGTDMVHIPPRIRALLGEEEWDEQR
jgi:hypothetical protein